MQSLRDTWAYWYKNHTQGDVKDLKAGIISFLDLFTPQQRDFLKTETKLQDFIAVIEKKKKEPFGEDSASDISTAQVFVNEYNTKRELRRQGQ